MLLEKASWFDYISRSMTSGTSKVATCNSRMTDWNKAMLKEDREKLNMPAGKVDTGTKKLPIGESQR